MDSEQNRRGSGDANQKRASFDSNKNFDNKKSTGSTTGRGTNAGGSKDARNDATRRDTKAMTTSGQGVSANGAADWKSQFNTPVATFEHKIQEFITGRPLTTAAIALGAGLAGAVILKKAMEGQQGEISSFQSTGAGGFLTQGIAPTLTRLESEVNRLATGGIGDVREGITSMVSNDLAEKPFETIATVVGLGFGLANLDVQSLKRGAIRVAKLLAMRSLDEMGSKKLGIEGETYGQA